MNRKLYLFDFDGTISNKDSFVHFLVKTFGTKKIALKLIANFHKLLLIAIINKKKHKVKEFILSILLKGKTKEEIQNLGKLYSEKYITEIIRPQAMAYILKINKEKADVFIVSASIDIWLYNFAQKNNMKLISTKLAYENSFFTGKFDGENCKGKEKVRRIKNEINVEDYNEVISFGDSTGDKEMFGISTSTHFKPFRK